jgi:hypothetical protein
MKKRFFKNGTKGKVIAIIIPLFLLSGLNAQQVKITKQGDDHGLVQPNTSGGGSSGGGNSGYSCTVTRNCTNLGVVVGSISCTGTEKCEMGFKAGALGFGGTDYVKCDGRITVC